MPNEATPVRPDTGTPVPPTPPRRRVYWVGLAVALALVALFVVFVAIPILIDTHPTVTAVITSTTSPGCNSPTAPYPIPGAVDPASLTSDRFLVRDMDTGTVLAEVNGGHLVGACELDLQFDVPGRARLIEVEDTSKPDVRWGPLDMRQIGADNWTSNLSANG